MRGRLIEYMVECEWRLVNYNHSVGVFRCVNVKARAVFACIFQVWSNSQKYFHRIVLHASLLALLVYPQIHNVISLIQSLSVLYYFRNLNLICVVMFDKKWV